MAVKLQLTTISHLPLIHDADPLCAGGNGDGLMVAASRWVYKLSTDTSY
jgi:hypothetical protein